MTLVVIEATSDYWKPFYYVLAEGLNVILVNARQVKNLPGRRTDVSDAARLAPHGAHGLVQPSFVPPEPVRELRDLTRARTTATREHGRVVQRLGKLLEDTGIKLSAVASDITGVSGRAMLEALIRGEADPQALADLAERKLRNKIPELTEALTGRIEEAMAPLRRAPDLLDTIPGINQATAEVITAETGGNMTRSASATHPASRAGVCSGHHESAGRTKNTRVRPGTPTSKEHSASPRSTR